MKHLLFRIIIIVLTLHVTAGAAWQSIYVNPSVYHNPRLAAIDTAKVSTLITTIDTFFSTKNQSLTANPYWSDADFKRYLYPYADLYQAEVSFRLQDSLHFRPTLLELLPVAADSYLAKIAYTGQEPAGFSSLRFIYNILITKQGNRYYLSKVTDYQTLHWERHTAGSIQFIISPGKRYSHTEALRLDSLNRHYASWLHMPVVQATYYSCTDSREMFAVKGFDYIPNMYFAVSGGLADADAAIIYSALNSEWYPHELAHLYINKIAAGKGGYLATEGVCTFLGGSLNLSLREHAQALKSFLQAHPGHSLYELMMQEQMVTETTSSTYTLGGIVAAAVYAQYGLQGLKDWLQTGDDPEQIASFFQRKFKTGTKTEMKKWLQEQLKHSTAATFR